MLTWPYDHWLTRNTYQKLVADADGKTTLTTAPAIAIYGREVKLRKTRLGRRFLFYRWVGNTRSAVYGNVNVLSEVESDAENAWWKATCAPYKGALVLHGRICVTLRHCGITSEVDARTIVQEGLDLYYKRIKNSVK